VGTEQTGEISKTRKMVWGATEKTVSNDSTILPRSRLVPKKKKKKKTSDRKGARTKGPPSVQRRKGSPGEGGESERWNQGPWFSSGEREMPGKHDCMDQVTAEGEENSKKGGRNTDMGKKFLPAANEKVIQGEEPNDSFRGNYSKGGVKAAKFHQSRLPRRGGGETDY